LTSGNPPDVPDLPGSQDAPEGSLEARDLKLVSVPNSSTSSSSSDTAGPRTSAGPHTSAPSHTDAPDSPEQSIGWEAAASALPSAGEQGDSDQSGLPIWLFVVLFVAFALVSGWQFRVAGALAQQVVGLESELATTTALLGAHQSRLVEIRGGVRALASQLEELKALVDADPESADESQGQGASAPARDADAGLEKIPARLAH